MPIQLDKILADIAEEKPLHPYSLASKVKKDQDDAWLKVGKKNKLSAHEAKSIFKVLQKKFEQEKLKPSSTWKLYQQMEDILRKEEEIKPKSEPDTADIEEESFVEFLEVREEDEDYEGESDNQDKSLKSNERNGSPEKETTTTNNVESKPEQKLLNTQMMIPQSTTQTVSAAFTNALQKKGISMRKTAPTTSTTKSQSLPSLPTRITAHPRTGSGAEATRSVVVADMMKRKASAVSKLEESSTPAKKVFTSMPVNAVSSNTPSSTTQPTAQIPHIEIKQEIVDDALEALNTGARDSINVITIPSNPPTVTTELSNGLTSTKTNGFNTRIEDIDFQKDIIFDNNPLSTAKPPNAPGDIINLGNFENQLSPTFFKNLCNSQRHEALGLYVANVMNRVSGKIAAKLELSILKAIIEAKTEELARL